MAKYFKIKPEDSNTVNKITAYKEMAFQWNTSKFTNVAVVLNVANVVIKIAVVRDAVPSVD
jgi:hypothetical protein